MTWNVQNLLRVGDPEGPATQAELEAKLVSLAQVIDAQQPDLLALQEVGHPDVLAALQQQLSHQLPHRLASAHPDQREIRVAMLSRLPLQQPIQVHPLATGLAPIQAGDPPANPSKPLPILDHLGRGALQATVSVDGHNVVVITAHLKSKLLSYGPRRFNPHDEGERARFGGYALYQRTAEAVTLRAHLNQVLAGQGRTRPVLLAGDLNDGIDTATTQILNGPPGSEIGTPGFARPDQQDGDRMWNLMLRLPPEQRATRIFHSHPETIDHIFASHFLVTRNTAVATATAVGGLRSVTEDPHEEVGKPGSDHAAVTATFDLAP
jgi:endonuclease/exonuclease/phosphatase family metal-dependent hydrolase